MTNKSLDPFPIAAETAGRIAGTTGSHTWMEDAYGDSAWLPPDAAASSKFIGLAARRRTVAVFFAFLAVLIFVLWGKTGYLIAQSSLFKARSDLNRIRTMITPASRGIIYDANGVQLTDNVSDLELALVPADLPTDPVERSTAIAKVAAIVGADSVSIGKLLEDFGPRGYQAVTIAENLSRDKAIQLTVTKSDIPAIRILKSSHRYYGLTNTLTSLAHVLGYMGRITADDLKGQDLKGYQPTDSIGRTGLEYAYEKELRGHPGMKKVEVDAAGNEVGTVAEEDAVLGENLRLTIDTGLMDAAEKSLKAMMTRMRLAKGAVVVEDVKSGGILALVSLPSYPNNLFAQGISAAEYKRLADDPNHPLFNRAISGTYPPGSTAKLMVASAALQEGVITPTTTVNSTGGILYADKWWFPDWKAGGHGITDLKKALAWSVNTFFYMIGGGYESFQGLGVERLGRYFRLFGVGTKLGIELPNEAAGFVPSPNWKQESKGEAWYIGDTYHISIGQGDLLATPLQMASWTAAVANGGTLWKPHLAAAFLDEQGNVIEEVKPSPIRTGIVDDRYLAAVRVGLRQTVTDGSAPLLRSCLMAVAGKTGTAQVSGKDNHAWFTGYGPFNDPQIAVTVLIENGKEGSAVAVPVAKDIFDWYAANRMNHG